MLFTLIFQAMVICLLPLAIVAVQSLTPVWLFATPPTAARQAPTFPWKFSPLLLSLDYHYIQWISQVFSYFQNI